MRGLILILALMPSFGHALSCLPWGVTDAYLEADASKDVYVPVLGTLTFDEQLLPLAQLKTATDLPEDATIPARFRGHALVRQGADVPFTTDLTFEVGCAAHWCGAAKSGEVLAFLRRDGDQYTLTTGPCGGNVFTKPNSEQIDLVRKCLKGRSCRPTARP